MKIAVAAPPFPVSIDDALVWLEKAVREAAAGKAAVICFPESYLPGYPGMPYPPEDRTASRLQYALDRVRSVAAEQGVAVVIPMDWHLPQGLVNLAFVIAATGELLGYQTKNQLDPSEDAFWTPGTGRNVFDINGLKIGITICHEGFRYPESVRWAARNGAAIVFHPQFNGSNDEGKPLTEWGAKSNPYYEKASMLRAMENTIFIATSNFASRFPESASAVIGPDGSCIAHADYGREQVLIVEIDPAVATGLLADRFNEKLYYR